MPETKNKIGIEPIEIAIGAAVALTLLVCHIAGALGLQIQALAACTGAVMCVQDSKKASWGAGLNRIKGVLCGCGVHDASMLDEYYQCAKLILEGDRGEPQQGGKRGGPPTMPPGPNGEQVYDRMIPHAGDGGAGKPQPAGNYYVKHHGSIKIVYDLDKTEDTLF